MRAGIRKNERDRERVTASFCGDVNHSCLTVALFAETGMVCCLF